MAMAAVGVPINKPPGGWFELSATYHGDRGEFWLLVKDSDGQEVERYNAKLLLGIAWEKIQTEPKP